MCLPASAADQIAKTEARSPTDEKNAFKLQPGFEAQLIAAEPDIQKPMQLAFDSKARLWATTSRHYPFPAETGKGTDKLFVLSDFDANGKATKVRIFDDHLNIPIGVLPLGDGSSVIVSEVGRILKLTDTDGDGKADKREVLFEGFGNQDTHGMTNSFTLMPDGWIYACHGYLNASKVKGRDGHEVSMQSGNTFRFRPDGSRIEVFTRGQVNPFGMCTDPWLNLYTADCHSRPMTQLIHGAHYDSFGKPHDGLGYAPHVINHMHGSTGLCGITYYFADYYPKEWQDVMFVGNCVTSRINCDKIHWHGATPVGKAQPDFLVSDDPWFRPVDIKLGPDGALYVSDFYNRIIGHYEVDLRHPQRDKDRGRIWRIVRTDAAPPANAKRTHADSNVLVMRALTSKPEWTNADRRLVLSQYLTSAEAQTKRASLDGITSHPHGDFAEPLLDLIPTIAADDTHMMMAARVALRECLRDSGLAPLNRKLTPKQTAALFGVAIAIRTKESSEFLAKTIGNEGIEPAHRIAAAEIIGQFEPSLSEFVLKSAGDSHAVAQGLMKGFLAGGLTALPEPLPVAIDKLVSRSLSARKPDTVAATTTLTMAVSFPQSAAAFETLDSTRLALALFNNSKTPPNVRANLAEALHPIPSVAVQTALNAALRDVNEPLVLRSRLIGLLLTKPNAKTRSEARTMLKAAPYALAVAIAAGLAGDASGAETLFTAIQEREAPARLLQERSVINRLKSAKVPDLDTKLAALTKNLPSTEQRIDDLIKARAAGFKKATPDVKLGKEVFVKNCALCHQLNNEGARVGPQLDGVGIRGLDRLLEDTMDPNRNIDKAFLATKLDLHDGRSVTGLLQREEGAVYVMFDALGKEVRIPKADVEEKTTLAQSAMPGNLDTTIPETDYYHLLAFLLEQKQPKTP